MQSIRDWLAQPITPSEVLPYAVMGALLALVLARLAGVYPRARGATRKDAADAPAGVVTRWFRAMQLAPGESLLVGVVFAAFAVLFFLALVAAFLAVGDAIRNGFADRPGGYGFSIGALLVALLGAPFLVWRTLVAQRTLEATQRQTELQDEALFNDKINAAATDLAARRQVTRVATDDDGKETILTEWQDDLVTRAAAIDRLEGLAREAMERDDYPPAQRIARMLSIYVQELSREYPAKAPPEHEERGQLLSWAETLRPVARPDMERAAQSLGRINPQDETARAAFDPTNVDLRDCNLQGFDLGKWNYQGAPMKRADLSGAFLGSTRFQDADLGETRWSGADLVKAQMQRANLSGAKMQGANLAEAQMQGGNLRRAKMQGAKLSGAQMQEADLIGAKMQGARLFRAEMQGANLFEAEMQGANLHGAKMQGAGLFSAEMQGADLFEAGMQGAGLVMAKMQGANLRRAEMQGAFLPQAEMQGADLIAAKMQGASLVLAEMQGANLFEAEMQSALLLGAQMQGANLRAAKMSEYTNTTDATLRGASVLFVDDTTIAKLQPHWDDIIAFLETLPEGAPDHWVEVRGAFDDDAFLERWRTWAATLDPPVTIQPDYHPD